MSYELCEPQTAFVTDSENFPRNWKVFQSVMKSNPSGVKFVGSEREETYGLGFSSKIGSGWDELTFGNFMWLRALALTESGIYGVWKKWDDLRRVFNEPKTMEEAFVPLSFEPSDVHLHFWLYLGCASI